MEDWRIDLGLCYPSPVCFQPHMLPLIALPFARMTNIYEYLWYYNYPGKFSAIEAWCLSLDKIRSDICQKEDFSRTKSKNVLNHITRIQISTVYPKRIVPCSYQKPLHICQLWVEVPAFPWMAWGCFMSAVCVGFELRISSWAYHLWFHAPILAWHSL